VKTRSSVIAPFVLAGRTGEHRRIEQGLADELGDVGGEIRVFDAGDEPLAHDDVRMQIFHHDHRLRAIEMKNPRRQPGGIFGLLGQRVVFIPAALERQGPGFADEPHIGQGLLDHHGAGRPFDDEDEVEVAVADLPDAPA